MSALSRPLHNLQVCFFGTEHVEIVKRLMDKLSSPDVLAVPNYRDSISGVRKSRVMTDASQDVLGAEIEQDQPDGTGSTRWYNPTFVFHESICAS